MAVGAPTPAAVPARWMWNRRPGRSALLWHEGLGFECEASTRLGTGDDRGEDRELASSVASELIGPAIVKAGRRSGWTSNTRTKPEIALTEIDRDGSWSALRLCARRTPVPV
jgi:hypothetical protein